MSKEVGVETLPRQYVGKSNNLIQSINKDLCVLFIYVPNSPPCKRLEPTIDDLFFEYRDVQFMKVNVDDPENEELEFHFEIYSIPQVIFLSKVDNKYKEVDRTAGANAEEIHDKIRRLSSSPNS